MTQTIDHPTAPSWPTPAPVTPTKKPMGRGVAVFITVMFFALCGACGVAIASGGSAGPSDHSGLACDHFRNVSSDAAKGLLTGLELRGKLREVYSNASIATPAVQAAAQEMLSLITTANSTGFVRAIGEMDDACRAAGH